LKSGHYRRKLVTLTASTLMSSYPQRFLDSMRRIKEEPNSVKSRVPMMGPDPKPVASGEMKASHRHQTPEQKCASSCLQSTHAFQRNTWKPKAFVAKTLRSRSGPQPPQSGPKSPSKCFARNTLGPKCPQTWGTRGEGGWAPDAHAEAKLRPRARPDHRRPTVANELGPESATALTSCLVRPG
jgi:hypothetical protein